MATDLVARGGDDPYVLEEEGPFAVLPGSGADVAGRLRRYEHGLGNAPLLVFGSVATSYNSCSEQD